MNTAEGQDPSDDDERRDDGQKEATEAGIVTSSVVRMGMAGTLELVAVVAVAVFSA